MGQRIGNKAINAWGAFEKWLVCGKGTNKKAIMSALMLRLSRKVHQRIFIGRDIQVVLLDIFGRAADIGIIAPKDVPVYREEKWLEKLDKMPDGEMVLTPDELEMLRQYRASRSSNRS